MASGEAGGLLYTWTSPENLHTWTILVGDNNQNEALWDSDVPHLHDEAPGDGHGVVVTQIKSL